MFAEQLWGNNRRKKWPVGVNPAGHPCCVTPSSGSKDITGGRGKGPLKVRKSCAVLEQPVMYYRLGQRSDQHSSPPWPPPERTLSLQQCVKSFSRGQNSRRKYSQWRELACLMACIGLSPLSAQEKDFPAVCTALASECVCPHVQKQAIFHTDGQYRGIGQWE